MSKIQLNLHFQALRKKSPLTLKKWICAWNVLFIKIIYQILSILFHIFQIYKYFFVYYRVKAIFHPFYFSLNSFFYVACRKSNKFLYIILWMFCNSAYVYICWICVFPSIDEYIMDFISINVRKHYDRCSSITPNTYMIVYNTLRKCIM